MDSLVDANVWLPILVERHEHHARAMDWWRTRKAGSACWCRPVQLTVLRLLTNQAIMGDDTLSPDEAWQIWEIMTLDERCAFLPIEPDRLGSFWRANVRGRVASPKLWMDAFLAAWAEAYGLAFTTFDAGFRNHGLTKLELLQP